MHKPGKWVIVGQPDDPYGGPRQTQGDHPLLLSAMCVCGDDECAYTFSAYLPEDCADTSVRASVVNGNLWDKTPE